MAEAEASGARRAELMLRTPPLFEVINRAALIEHAFGHGASSEPLTPQLRIDDPAYAPHFFHEGQTFVSRAFRYAARLPDDAARFLPVDSSRCRGMAAERDYRCMEVLHVGDVIDRDASDGEWRERRRSDGTVRRTWMPAVGPGRPAPRVVLKDGFAAPAPIFHATGLPWLLVTDDLAERIAAARVDGITFARPERERGQGEAVFKEQAHGSR